MLTKMNGQKIGVATKGGKTFDLYRVEIDNGPDIVAVIDPSQSEKGIGGRLFKVTHTDAHHAEKVYTEAGYSVKLDPIPQPEKPQEVQKLEAALGEALREVSAKEEVIKDLREQLGSLTQQLKEAKKAAAAP